MAKDSTKATAGSQLPNGAELLKFNDSVQSEVGVKQFAHLQLQRKGHITAPNFNRNKHFVVNEYGQDVASHHFGSKIKNNRKNNGSRTKISQTNKSVLLKHPAAGTQYLFYRNKEN